MNLFEISILLCDDAWQSDLSKRQTLNQLRQEFEYRLWGDVVIPGIFTFGSGLANWIILVASITSEAADCALRG